MVCEEFAGEGLVTETGTNREEQGPMRRAVELVRHYAGVMAHEFDSVPADDAEVLGILAYSSLAFMTRLAKDGEQAPTFEAHVEHARMAARCFKLYQQLEVWSEHRGFDLLAAGDAFSGAYDDLDARTRPTTFAERAVKTFITRGMLGDMLIRVAQGHGLFEGIEDVWPFEQGHWVRAHLGPQIEADEQLSARLSLWGRRVAGEALGLVRATLFTYPSLAASPENVDEITEYVIKRHGERMKDIHLKA